MNTSDLRKYFNRRKPSGSIVLLIFGILLFLVGASVDGGFLWALIGVALFATGTYLIAKFSKNQSDGAVDAICQSQANEYYTAKKALVGSNDNGIKDAVYSCEYSFENIFSARKAIKGRDGIWRSSIFEMSCLFFTKDTAYHYSKKISLITEEKAEKQKEFNLRDIKMVSLEEMNQSLAVAIVIPGNEKIYVTCKNREEAANLCDKIKEKTFKREQEK